jgi:hypothetical protein
VLHALPVKIVNALGYASSSDYDYRWEKPAKTIDVNGEMIACEYDNIGRVRKIIAPNEYDSGAPFSIAMLYDVETTGNPVSLSQNTIPVSFEESPRLPMLQAITLLYNEQDSCNPFVTIINTDGFGRVIQTFKSIEVNGSPLFQVSGRTVCDAFGRTTKQYAPLLDSNIKTVCLPQNNVMRIMTKYESNLPVAVLYSYNPIEENLPHPASTTYDILDRPLSITNPIGETTSL